MVHGYGYHRISRIPVSEASSPSQTLAVVRTAELLAVSEGAVCSGPRGPRVVDHVIGLMEMIIFWRKIYQKTMFSPWNLTIYIGFLNLFSKTIVQCPWGLLWTSKTANHTLKAMKVLNPVSWFRWWCYSVHQHETQKCAPCRICMETNHRRKHTHTHQEYFAQNGSKGHVFHIYKYIYTVIIYINILKKNEHKNLNSLMNMWTRKTLAWHRWIHYCKSGHVRPLPREFWNFQLFHLTGCPTLAAKQLAFGDL